MPEVYGTNHLGSVRAMATALMVVSTAIGPGITGLAIDWGVSFPQQAIFHGAVVRGAERGDGAGHAADRGRTLRGPATDRITSTRAHPSGGR